MKEEILKLKDGERFIIPEGDYGRAEIWRINSVYIVFEIPLFGGEPIFNKTFWYEEVERMLDEINSWN